MAKRAKKKKEPEILQLSPNTIAGYNVIKLRQIIANHELQITLMRDLIEKLDPDHDYRFDAQANGFVKTERKKK